MMTNFTPYLKFLSQILNETVIIFLFIGSVFGLLAGLMLLFDSARAFRIGDRLNRWVSTRAALRPLEAHRSISRPLYRMHRLSGMLICAGALFALSVLATSQGELAIAKSLRGLGPVRFDAFVAQSLRVILLVGNIAALLFGLVFIFRPSALKRLEAWADRNVSGRKPTKPLEEMHRPADRFLLKHPRLIGGLIVLGSLYVMVNLGYALLR